MATLAGQRAQFTWALNQYNLAEDSETRTRFAKRMAKQGIRYDLIMLDCPPGLSLLTVNAIVAADGLIIPVVPDPMVAEALDTLLAAADRVRERMASRGKVVGILLNAIDPQRKHMRQVAERLRAQHRDAVFHTEIPTPMSQNPKSEMEGPFLHA